MQNPYSVGVCPAPMEPLRAMPIPKPTVLPTWPVKPATNPEPSYEPARKLVKPATNSEPSYQSALCLIPPKELWPQIQAIRCEKDRAYSRWMPHINLFYPFETDQGSQFPDLADQLTEALKDFSPFAISLDHLSHFDRRRDCQLFAGANPENGLQNLWKRVRKELPKNIRNGNRNHFKPHLSLGQYGKSEIISAMETLQRSWGKNKWIVDQVYMISRNGNVPFEIKHVIKLGGLRTVTRKMRRMTAKLSSGRVSTSVRNQESSDEPCGENSSSDCGESKPGLYYVQRTCRVRMGKDKTSAIVQDLHQNTLVKVVDIQNNRARIVLPVCGWVSVATKKGPMLRFCNSEEKNNQTTKT